MPGRTGFDALSIAISAVQLPKFAVDDNSQVSLDPEFGADGWSALKDAAADVETKAKHFHEHPHLHDSVRVKAGDVVTAATSFQGTVMTAYNEWRAVPDGEKVKQTEAMVGLGNMLQYMRSHLDDEGEFPAAKLDARTALFGS